MGEADGPETLFRRLLRRAVDRNATDVHIKANAPPSFRIDGALRPRKPPALTQEDIDGIVEGLLTPERLELFRKDGEADVAFMEPDLGRFRVNIFRQRGSTSIVVRHVNDVIPSIKALHLPPEVERFAHYEQGLVLITGTTGSGKSTSLAAIIDDINGRRQCHIVTLEDPIVYTHADKKAIVNQREVGIDTRTVGGALRTMMGQDPDVILIDELRDLDTFQAAMSAAERGHLVLCALSTPNAMLTIERIIELFPSNQHDQISSKLSLNLRAILSQRLLPQANESGRVPACEALFVSPAVSQLIKDNRIQRIPLSMQHEREEGMLTLNDSLFALLQNQQITPAVAMQSSDNPAELELMLEGNAAPPAPNSMWEALGRRLRKSLSRRPKD